MGWHGEWEAAIRTVLGALPAEENSPPPLAVQWILDPGELDSAALPESPIIIFTDANDARSAELFRWAQEVRAGCSQGTLGGPGYGVSTLLRCPAPG